MKKLSLPLLPIVLAGCVAEPIRLSTKPQAPSASVVSEANFRGHRDVEVQFAINAKKEIEHDIPGVVVTVENARIRDDYNYFIRLTVDMPLIARQGDGYGHAMKYLNNYSRTLATWRGFSTLENLRNPADAMVERFAASTSTVQVEDGGTMTLIKRIDASVPKGAMRVILTPKPI